MARCPRRSSRDFRHLRACVLSGGASPRGCTALGLSCVVLVRRLLGIPRCRNRLGLFHVFEAHVAANRGRPGLRGGNGNGAVRSQLYRRVRKRGLSLRRLTPQSTLTRASAILSYTRR